MKPQLLARLKAKWREENPTRRVDNAQLEAALIKASDALGELATMKGVVADATKLLDELAEAGLEEDGTTTVGAAPAEVDIETDTGLDETAFVADDVDLGEAPVVDAAIPVETAERKVNETPKPNFDHVEPTGYVEQALSSKALLQEVLVELRVISKLLSSTVLAEARVAKTLNMPFTADIADGPKRVKSLTPNSAPPADEEMASAPAPGQYQYEVVKQSKMPGVYLNNGKPDNAAIKAAIREGVEKNGKPPHIPGVKICVRGASSVQTV